MSFDIAVFDPEFAPTDSRMIPDWLVDDPDAPLTPRLQRWERDMRARFGGYEDAPDTLEAGARFAEYSGGGPVVRLSSVYGVASELEAAVLETAVAHGVGFWVMSAANERTWMPPTSPVDGTPRPGFSLTIENLGDLPAPSEALVVAAIQWLDSTYGPGYVILSAPNGDYVQTLGTPQALTVEWRTWLADAGAGAFRHVVAATSGDQTGELEPLVAYGRERRILSNERLRARDAVLVFRDFVRGEDPTPRYAWHDITAALM